MPVKYSILENTLTTPSTFKGRVNETSTLSLNLIVRGIMSRGSTVTEADISAVIIDMIKVCKDAISDGSRVNIEGLVQLYPTMEGVFAGGADSFDPLRHKLNIGSRASEQLKAGVRAQAVMEKETAPMVGPIIIELLDVWTDQINITVTPAQNVNIAGDRMKFDASRADEGLYFVNDTTVTTTQVPAGAIAASTDKKLIFNSSTAGTAGDTCHYEVRTRLGNSPSYPLKTAFSLPLTLG